MAPNSRNTQNAVENNINEPVVGPSRGSKEQPQETPHVIISVQPARKACNFRYRSEGRVSWIPGAIHKSHPTIEVVGYTGQASVVVSCVTDDTPHRQHPHNVESDQGICESGVLVMAVNIEENNRKIPFERLGIMCVTKEDRPEELRRRQRRNFDPFGAGFDHIEAASELNANVVRLCFQVYLPNESGLCRVPLDPVVTTPVYDKKVKTDLVIVEASELCGTCLGRTKIILLCEKVTKNDKILFFLKNGDEVEWQHTVERFTVHKNMAIIFKTPPFYKHITEPVAVSIQLERSENNTQSNVLEFIYKPEYKGLKPLTLPHYGEQAGPSSITTQAQNNFPNEPAMTAQRYLFMELVTPQEHNGVGLLDPVVTQDNQALTAYNEATDSGVVNISAVIQQDQTVTEGPSHYIQHSPSIPASSPPSEQMVPVWPPSSADMQEKFSNMQIDSHNQPMTPQHHAVQEPHDQTMGSYGEVMSPFELTTYLPAAPSQNTFEDLKENMSTESIIQQQLYSKTNQEDRMDTGSLSILTLSTNSVPNSEELKKFDVEVFEECCNNILEVETKE